MGCGGCGCWIVGDGGRCQWFVRIGIYWILGFSGWGGLCCVEVAAGDGGGGGGRWLLDCWLWGCCRWFVRIWILGILGFSGWGGCAVWRWLRGMAVGVAGGGCWIVGYGDVVGGLSESGFWGFWDFQDGVVVLCGGGCGGWRWGWREVAAGLLVMGVLSVVCQNRDLLDFGIFRMGWSERGLRWVAAWEQGWWLRVLAGAAEWYGGG